MKNKECLHVASVDVGVLLESHCKQCYVYSLDMMAVLFSATLTPHRLYADILRHERNTDEALPTPPAPFTLSPPPCRCWMGGPLYRTCWWWSYSSCQAPSCLLHQSEYRRSQPSQLNCCSHSTWTDGGDGGKTLYWQQESIKGHRQTSKKELVYTDKKIIKCCISLKQNSAYVFSWFKALLRPL